MILNGRSLDFLHGYPWLSFEPNIRLTEEMLFRTGRIQAMLEELVTTPLKPAQAERLLKVALTKSIHGTTAIEGGTLSEERVAAILEDSINIEPPSRQPLGREILNVESAYKWAESAPIRRLLSVDGVQHIHRLIASGLAHVDAEPGRFRSTRVVVGGGIYRAPCDRERDVIQLMERTCQWLRGVSFARLPLLSDLIRAIVAHVYLEWVHPFADGNGRTGRTLEYGLLIAAGLPQVGALALANHYNLTRQLYMRHLDRASREHRGDLTEFVEYALQGLEDGVAESLQAVRSHVTQLSWESFVYERFRHEYGSGLSAARARCRRLALDLAYVPEGLTRAEIRRRFDHLYGERTGKTLTRDLHALTNLRLVDAADGKVRALISTMRHFSLKARSPDVEKQQGLPGF